jgi:predicted MFS family arabinose efflux permease
VNDGLAADADGVAVRQGPGAIRSPAAILAILTGLNLLNYIDRYVMAAVLPKVQEDLGLSNALGGSLMTVFLVGFFATSPLFGTWADRVGTGGRKRLLLLGVAVWSAATIASGLARGAASLVAARAVVGVGEASFTTIAPAIIDDLAMPSKKARSMATFNAAIPVGSALGFIVGGVVEHASGYRNAFFVAGVPGLVLGLLCLLIAEPERHAIATPRLFESARTLLRIPLYRGAVLGYAAYTFAIGGFAFWAPKYLHARYGLDAGLASRNFGLVTVVCGLAGTLAGGWLADALARRIAGDREAASLRANLVVCALAAGLGAPFAALAILAGTPGGFFAAAVPCEVALFMSSGPVNLTLLRSVPGALRASAMALAIFMIHLLGDMWSPYIMGKVADAPVGIAGASPWVLAMLIVPVVFGVAALVWWRASARLTGTAAVR